MKNPFHIARAALVAFCLVAVLPKMISASRENTRVLPVAGELTTVNSDSIASMIKFLSIDADKGESKTRFALRENAMNEIADSLAQRLERYTGSQVQRMQFTFRKMYNYVDSTYTAWNIVGRIPGDGRIDGAFVLCAHYDAIASRTPGWIESWMTSAAPGADDNASGVATVMEAARVLSSRQRKLPFDIIVALFSAEEFSCLGSEDFVSKIFDVYDGQIIGAINFDMLGWPSGAERTVTIISNPLSAWLSSCMESYLEESAIGIAGKVILSSPIQSDHWSFWSIDISAIDLMEPLANGVVAYPYYHTLLDTFDKIDFEQVASIANGAIGFLCDLENKPAQIVLLESDLFLRRNSIPTLQRIFKVGESIEIGARIRNLGSSDPPQGAKVTLDISIETAKGERQIHSREYDAPSALGFVSIFIPLELGVEDAGTNIVKASISVSGMANDPSNDEASLSFAVETEGKPLLTHSIQPNPIRGRSTDASFCLDLAGPADAHLEIFTLEGEKLASCYVEEKSGESLQAGLNCVSLNRLFPEMPEIKSGIYIYRLIVFSQGSKEEAMGKFAVIR